LTLSGSMRCALHLASNSQFVRHAASPSDRFPPCSTVRAGSMFPAQSRRSWPARRMAAPSPY